MIITRMNLIEMDVSLLVLTLLAFQSTESFINERVQLDYKENSDSEENFQGRLVHDLLRRYGKGYVRPVLNTSTTTKVIYRLLIHELVLLDSKNQRITISALLKQTWTDEFLRWNSSQYGNITIIQLPSNVIWIPDITLYRNIDGEFERIKETKAIIDHNGTIAWFAPAILTSSCRIHVRYFPFDTQTCQMRFGSWAYNGLEIDLRHEEGTDAEQNRFMENGVWDLKQVNTERVVKKYLCCPEPYPELVFTLVLKRRSDFYVAYLILPCVFLSGLSLLVFYLPPECGEKLTLSITNLLALVVFQQLVAESMPPSGDDPPLIGAYFLSMIVMVCLSVVLTVLVINISARTCSVPAFIRFVVLRYLARITCMYRQEFDRQLSPTVQDAFHEFSINDCKLRHMNVDAMSKDDSRFLQDASFSSDAKVMESLQEDLKFIRRDLEGKNTDELKVLQWKHVATVLDRCLLIIFLVYGITTTCVLIWRAKGPE